MVKLVLDQIVDEICVFEEELQHHLNFYDSKSTFLSPPQGKVDFSNIFKIEKFIAYILKYKSDLFKMLPQPGGGYMYAHTALSKEFNPYDFLYYQSQSPDQFVSNLVRYSFRLQSFVKTLGAVNENYQTRTIPEILLNNSGGINSPIPRLDCELSHQQRGNINYFVNCVRANLGQFNLDQLVKNQIKKTNAKYREYCDYVDKLFNKHGDLTFISLDLCLFREAKLVESLGRTLNLADLKTKLLNYGRNVDPLSRSVGYIGKWEWSEVKLGLYFRIIFIFPSDKICDVKTIQNELNFYWCETITEGTGLCHHASLAAKPAKFKKSYCSITANDEKTKNIFKQRVIGYLTKIEKYYCPPEIRQSLKNMLNQTNDYVTDRELSLTFRGHGKKD